MRGVESGCRGPWMRLYVLRANWRLAEKSLPTESQRSGVRWAWHLKEAWLGPEGSRRLAQGVWAEMQAPSRGAGSRQGPPQPSKDRLLYGSSLAKETAPPHKDPCPIRAPPPPATVAS